MTKHSTFQNELRPVQRRRGRRCGQRRSRQSLQVRRELPTLVLVDVSFVSGHRQAFELLKFILLLRVGFLFLSSYLKISGSVYLLSLSLSTEMPISFNSFVHLNFHSNVYLSAVDPLPVSVRQIRSH